MIASGALVKGAKYAGLLQQTLHAHHSCGQVRLNIFKTATPLFSGDLMLFAAMGMERLESHG